MLTANHYLLDAVGGADHLPRRLRHRPARDPSRPGAGGCGPEPGGPEVVSAQRPAQPLRRSGDGLAVGGHVQLHDLGQSTGDGVSRLWLGIIRRSSGSRTSRSSWSTMSWSRRRAGPPGRAPRTRGCRCGALATTGSAGAAGLEGGDAERLEVGRRDEDVGSGELLADLVPGEAPDEPDHVAEAVARRGTSRATRRSGPSPTMISSHGGSTAARARAPADHPQQVQRALAGRQPHDRDDASRRAGRGRPARRPSRRRCRCRSGSTTTVTPGPAMRSDRARRRRR